MSESENLVPLCADNAIAQGEIGAATLPDGRKVAIYNVAGKFYVTDDLCTHGEASLSEEGALDGCVVECGWHFGTFDVTTGEAKNTPCTIPLRTYPAVVRDNMILIAVSDQVKQA